MRGRDAHLTRRLRLRSQTPRFFRTARQKPIQTDLAYPLTPGVTAKHASRRRTRLTSPRVSRMFNRTTGLSTFFGPEDASHRPHPDTPHRHRRDGRPGCDCGDYSGSWALRASTGTRPIQPSPEVRRGLRAFSSADCVDPCGDYRRTAAPLFWRSLEGVPNCPAPAPN